MVTCWHILSNVSAPFAAVHRSGDAVLEKLDPPVRAAVIMALLGLTLVGLFLITFIMVGGHWVRRLARHRPAPRQFGKTSESATAFTGAGDVALPEHKTSDTLLLDNSSRDTKVET